MIDAINTGKTINEKKQFLAQWIIEKQYEKHPELEATYGDAGRIQALEDTLFYLNYLAESIKMGSIEIFALYLEWAQPMHESRKIPLEYLIDNLKFMDHAIFEFLSHKDYLAATGYIATGIEKLKAKRTLPSSFLAENNPMFGPASEYLHLLLQGNRKQAQALVISLVTNGSPVSEIYEYIFKVCQCETGRLWQLNKITIAHEHYCSAATQSIMASLYPYIFDSEKKGAKMVACTVSGDMHEIGIRMVSDLFEMEGWDTYYMGANMPDSSIINALKEQKADLLALSVTVPFHITNAQELIEKIRNDKDLHQTKVILGGYAFNHFPDLCNKLGADGSMSSAKDAIAFANQLVLNR